MLRQLTLILIISLLLTGCVKAISEESRKLVDNSISFSKLRENPDAFIGKYVMLGGLIAAVRNSKEGGQLEVVQLKLDENGLPEDALRSDGRFLATSMNFFDSMIYKPGRSVTLVGEIKGKKNATIDEINYVYPLVSVKEIQVWPAPEEDRGFPLPTAPYYDPYYFGYGSDIYMLRPTAPRSP
jgi:outer membrane lipoprotein